MTTNEELESHLKRVREHLHSLGQPLQIISGRTEQIARQLGVIADQMPEQGPSVRAILRSPTWITECAIAVLSLLLGLVLISPGDTFSSGVAYAGMRFLPELAWGAVMLGLSVAQWLAIFLGGRAARRWCAWAAFVLWMALTGLFLTGNPAGVGWTLALNPTLAALWVVIRGPS